MSIVIFRIKWKHKLSCELLLFFKFLNIIFQEYVFSWVRLRGISAHSVSLAPSPLAS